MFFSPENGRTYQNSGHTEGSFFSPENGRTYQNSGHTGGSFFSPEFGRTERTKIQETLFEKETHFEQEMSF